MSVTNSNGRRYCLFGSQLMRSLCVQQRKWYTSGKWSRKSPLQKVMDTEHLQTNQRLSKFINEKPEQQHLTKSSSLSSLREDIAIEDGNHQKLGAFEREKYERSIELYFKLPKTRMRANKLSMMPTSLLRNHNAKFEKKTSEPQGKTYDRSKENKKFNDKKIKRDALPIKENATQKENSKYNTEDSKKNGLDKEICAKKAHKESQAKKRPKKLATDSTFNKNISIQDIENNYRSEPPSKNALNSIKRTTKETNTSKSIPAAYTTRNTPMKCKNWYSKMIAESKKKTPQNNINKTQDSKFELGLDKPITPGFPNSNQKPKVSEEAQSHVRNDRECHSESGERLTKQMNSSKNALAAAAVSNNNSLSRNKWYTKRISESENMTQAKNNSEQDPKSELGLHEQVSTNKPIKSSSSSLLDTLDPQSELKVNDCISESHGSSTIERATQQMNFTKNAKAAATINHNNSNNNSMNRKIWYSKRISDYRKNKAQSKISKEQVPKFEMKLDENISAKKPINSNQGNQLALNPQSKLTLDKKDEGSSNSNPRSQLSLDFLDPQSELRVNDCDSESEKNVSKNSPAGPATINNPNPMKGKKWYSKNISESHSKPVKDKSETNIRKENSSKPELKLDECRSESEPITNNFSNSNQKNQQCQDSKPEFGLFESVAAAKPIKSSSLNSSLSQLPEDTKFELKIDESSPNLNQLPLDPLDPQSELRVNELVSESDGSSKIGRTNKQMSSLKNTPVFVFKNKTLTNSNKEQNPKSDLRIKESVSTSQPISFSSMNLTNRLSESETECELSTMEVATATGTYQMSASKNTPVVAPTTNDLVKCKKEDSKMGLEFNLKSSKHKAQLNISQDQDQKSKLGMNEKRVPKNQPIISSLSESEHKSKLSQSRSSHLECIQQIKRN